MSNVANSLISQYRQDHPNRQDHPTEVLPLELQLVAEATSIVRNDSGEVDPLASGVPPHIIANQLGSLIATYASHALTGSERPLNEYICSEHPLPLPLQEKICQDCVYKVLNLTDLQLYKESVNQNLKIKEQYAKLMNPSEIKNWVLTRIAYEYMRADNLEEAERVLQEVEREANLAKDDNTKSIALRDSSTILSYIFRGHINAGRLEEAERIAQEKKRITLLIPINGREKNQLLRGVLWHLVAIAARYKRQANFVEAERIDKKIINPKFPEGINIRYLYTQEKTIKDENDFLSTLMMGFSISDDEILKTIRKMQYVRALKFTILQPNSSNSRGRGSCNYF